MNALNALNTINKQLSVYQTRLATGKRINSASDDPAGLTIATKFSARSQGLSTALGNIGDAKNLLAVAESGMSGLNDIVIEMRNKAEAGASDTMGQAERQALIDQMAAYAQQIDDVVKQTKWTSTGSSLIGGSYNTTALTFQTGVDQGETTTMSGLIDLSASGTNLALATVSSSGVYSLTFTSGTGTTASTVTLSSTSSAADFSAYMSAINTKLDVVSGQLSKIGALTSRLTYKEEQLTSAQTNTEAAFNRIMNADMAQEQVNASKYTILQQTATAMLSQANSAPQFLLTLFK
jgi:flagellin